MEVTTLRKFLTLVTSLLALSLLALSTIAFADHHVEKEKHRVLIVDGQNPYHPWQDSTPFMKRLLENTGHYSVDVATVPQKPAEQITDKRYPADASRMDEYNPQFGEYDAVLSNYSGPDWNNETRQRFVDFVTSGGAFVSIHAADNAFPGWVEYNRMTGLGGWGDRNEKSGPYVRWQENAQKMVLDYSPGRGGSHGKREPFLIEVRVPDHPITRGLPSEFMQTEDELYGELRGPTENLHVLATAFSRKENGGTGEHEPILMTTHFGRGRVFHSVLGHDLKAMSGVAFQQTLLRGIEWALTGQVTLPDVSEGQLSATEPIERAVPESPESDSTDQTAGIPDIDADGWKSLFNGKDLDGWTQRNGTATYEVKEGVILGRTATGSPNSFLCSNEDYDDFELTFEVKVDNGLNSGVQIRSKSLDDYKKGRVHGPQVEIESAPGEAGYLYSEATGRGWITTEQPIKDAFKNDQFNRYIVRAVGDRFQTWINGTEIADIRDGQSFKEGFIGLQVHSIKADQGPFEVRWRDIRVRPINP
ncbi:MAG: family 16 glycoside hydrolase [Planctomycetota bacterium]